MTTLVMVCTGDKYPHKSCTNIEYQLVNVGFDFQRSHVVTRGEGSVYDKLKIFEQCNKEDENYVYFDLDVVIKDTIDVVRDEFTLLYVETTLSYSTQFVSHGMEG